MRSQNIFTSNSVNRGFISTKFQSCGWLEKLFWDGRSCVWERWCNMLREHRVSEKVTMLAVYCPANIHLQVHMSTTTHRMTTNKFRYLLQKMSEEDDDFLHSSEEQPLNFCLRTSWSKGRQSLQRGRRHSRWKKACFDNENSCLVWNERQL